MPTLLNPYTEPRHDIIRKLDKLKDDYNYKPSLKMKEEIASLEIRYKELDDKWRESTEASLFEVRQSMNRIDKAIKSSSEIIKINQKANDKDSRKEVKMLYREAINMNRELRDLVTDTVVLKRQIREYLGIDGGEPKGESNGKRGRKSKVIGN